MRIQGFWVGFENVVFFNGFSKVFGGGGFKDDGKRFAEVNGVNELRGTFRASAGRAKAS